MSDVLASAEPSPRFRRWFAWHTKRMTRKSFRRVMLTPEGREIIQAAAIHDGPIIIAGSHTSWWDPLFALRLVDVFMPERTMCAPIEMEQYERFGVLRKLGIFGLNQHHPLALSRMIEFVKQRAETQPHLVFCITPQGEFSDVRRPIRIRPGVAAVAAAIPGARVLTLCGEYTFWQDRKPEVMWHAGVCELTERPTTARWHRAIRQGMRQTAAELAERVMNRDESAFVGLPNEKANSSGTAVNPFYDFWLRLRGVGTRIDSAHRANGQPPHPGDVS